MTWSTRSPSAITKKRRDGGQTLIEFAGLVPVFIILILAAFVTFLAILSLERIEHAARTGARVAAQTGDAGRCLSEAKNELPEWIRDRDASPPKGPRIRVERHYEEWNESRVSCEVTARVPALWAGVQIDYTITRRVEMPIG